MTANTINYQRIYEEELDTTLRDSLGFGPRFFEMTDPQRRFVEALVDIGYQEALTDALDPAILDDTADLSLEMANQLSSFSGMLRAYLLEHKDPKE